MIGNRPDHLCGRTCRKRIGRNVPCYDAPCPNHTVISYCYTWAHNDISTEPAIISNCYRFGIAQETFYAIATYHSSAFFGDHWMHRCDDGYIWTEIIVISDRYHGVVLHSKIEIHEAMCADFCVTTIVEVDRSEHKCTIANFQQQIF